MNEAGKHDCCHRILLKSSAVVCVCLFHLCIFNVCLCLFKCSQYNIHPVNVQTQTLQYLMTKHTKFSYSSCYKRVCVCVCARACMHGQRFSLNSWRSMHINPLLTNYGTISLLLWITKEYYSLLLVNITFFSLLPLCARWSMYEQHQKLEARSWRGSERQCEVG